MTDAYTIGIEEEYFLVDARTKRLRNRIVGYITRLKIVEVNRASATTEIPSEPSEQ